MKGNFGHLEAANCFCVGHNLYQLIVNLVCGYSSYTNSPVYNATMERYRMKVLESGTFLLSNKEILADLVLGVAASFMTLVG